MKYLKYIIIVVVLIVVLNLGSSWIMGKMAEKVMGKVSDSVNSHVMDMLPFDVDEAKDAFGDIDKAKDFMESISEEDLEKTIERGKAIGDGIENVVDKMENSKGLGKVLDFLDTF